MNIFFENNDLQTNAADILPPHIVALIRERQRRLASIPRYDRYIARATGHPTLQGFWRNLKRQDEEVAQRLKNWLDREAADHARMNLDDPSRLIGFDRDLGTRASRRSGGRIGS